MGGVRPERGIRPQTKDPQHPNLFGSIWTLVGLPPKHPRLVGYRSASSSLTTSFRHGAMREGEVGSWWDHTP